LILNIEHRQFLKPLVEWRILDLDSLIMSSGNLRKYWSAQKLIKRLEEKKLVKIYRDPWNKKNYIYLSELGIKEISPDLRPALNSGTLYHDSKVTVLGQEILKCNLVFQSIQLEHQIKKGKGVRGVQDLLPDARVLGSFKGTSFEAAIELELNQKEKSRIIEKGNYYLKSNYYNHALYFFPDVDLLKTYYETLKESLGDDFNKKIFLFSCPNILKLKPSFEDGVGIVMNKNRSFLEVFGGVQ
jgi:hypothetical protein